MSDTDDDRYEILFDLSELDPTRPQEPDRVSIPNLDLWHVDFVAGGKYFDASQPEDQRCGVFIKVFDPEGTFEWPVSEADWPYQWPYWRKLFSERP